jgi:U3 small nucleolar RNA-associated protein 10
VDADKFHKIYPVLLKQLSLVDMPDYMDHMTEHVIPCIAQLAVLVGNDALWKPLNQKLMLKTRDEHPHIRLACLHLVQELYLKLGEDLLVLLPETIPFLAELMEDVDPQVEMACQKVCQSIEHYLGEPIQHYFNN